MDRPVIILSEWRRGRKKNFRKSYWNGSRLTLPLPGFGRQIRLAFALENSTKGKSKKASSIFMAFCDRMVGILVSSLRWATTRPPPNKIAFSSTPAMPAPLHLPHGLWKKSKSDSKPQAFAREALPISGKSSIHQKPAVSGVSSHPVRSRSFKDPGSGGRR